jgi:Protein of unknown function (DUF3892)
MPVEVRVQCINKTARYDPHQRIRAIGGVNPDGTRWKLTEDQAILGIKQGRWSFYVRVGNDRANLDVAISQWGTEYLRTVPDGVRPDNLLSLPECP